VVGHWKDADAGGGDRLNVPATRDSGAEKVLRVEEVLVVMSATLVAAISVWGGATIYRTLYRPF
jgi:hypothetical protein